jgi:hypothetical protein
MHHRSGHVDQIGAKLTLELLQNVGGVCCECNANDVIGISGGRSSSHGIDESARNLQRWGLLFRDGMDVGV